MPCNAVTNRPYSGCNVVLLWIAQNAGYRTPRYVTFRQAAELGGHVQKGEHGTKVYFVKQLAVHTEDGEETKACMVPMLREYTVFNVDQCEGLPASVMAAGAVKPRNPDERDATIDEFLSTTGADIREGHGEAYFVPSKDFISMLSEVCGLQETLCGLEGGYIVPKRFDQVSERFSDHHKQ